MPRELVDEARHGSVELVGGNDLGDEAERERLVGGDAPPAHDDVLRTPEPDETCEPLRAARAGDHPDRHLRESELEVVGGEPEVAGERELEPDAEAVAVKRRDHRLRAALRRRDVVGEARDVPGRPLQEPGDVAAGGERLAGAGQHDEADGVVAVELLEDAAELVARVHRDAVELARDVERDRRDAALGVALDPEAVVLAHDSSRSMRRRIFPDGLFGSSGTKRYSRGRLKRASVSDAEAERVELVRGHVPVGDDVGDDVLSPAVVGRADDGDLAAHPGARASTSSTSTGWMFSPPEMTMSSTRPTTQRSPSSSIRPTSPVWYQPSRIAFSSASGRFQ